MKDRLMFAAMILLCVSAILAGILSVIDHDKLDGYVKAESVQRVTTIGERCEETAHQAKILDATVGVTNPESQWFERSFHRCLESLAKVEARSGHE